MLPLEDIERAVAIHRRSYTLLRWVTEGIERGIITFTRAHHCAPAREAARQWVEDHYENLPEVARPERPDLPEFANYFAAYVTTSFDLVEHPGQRFVDPCGGGFTLCGYLVNASHLRTKKPAKGDKEKALRVCIARVEMLASEAGMAITRERAVEIATSERQRRNAAYSAYLQSVLDRMRGEDGGLHVLSLWRMIAWKPEGSPIRSFRLEAGAVARAEEEILAEIEAGG